MLATLLAGALFAQGQNDVRVHMPQLAERPGGQKRLNLYWREEPMAATKLSPKKFGPTQEPYTFDWVMAGFAKLDPASQQATVRFRVYNQLKPKVGDETFGATRLLLRLWETLASWGSDHSYEYAGGVVDLYLCWGGKAGGEAHFDQDSQVPAPANNKVATIYIYDLPSFTAPIERAREVAHEYGHIVLPAFGGYSDPEEWANGVLGERLFLSQLATDLETKEIPAEDAFGLTVPAIRNWLATNVTPHLNRAAIEGPFSPVYSRRDGVGMNAVIGEATFLQAMLPPKRFGRTLFLMESQKAEALIKSAPLAMEEGGAELKVPAALQSKAIWIPVGKTKVSGAKVLSRRSGWAKVQPDGATITLKL